MVRLAVVAKPIPVLCLAAWVFRASASGARWIAAGLVLSAVGDVALEITGGPGAFLAGMLAFAAAHAAYIGGFLAVSKAPRFGLLLPFGVWGAGLFAFIHPGLGAMAAPVAVYALLLAAMMWRATASGARTAALGAVLFGLSDSLLAIDRFHAPVPGARWLIMALYWAGQWGIARSFAGPSSTASR
jgi:uncharacterized membrane protein YhhN